MKPAAEFTLALLAASIAVCLPATLHAASCRVATTAVRFGNYNPLNLAPRNRNSTITVRCTGSGTFTAALSAGQSTSYNPRFMTSITTGDQLDYNLYTNPARTIIWGDGTAGTQTVNGRFNNNRVRLTVYGQIPAMENIAAGTYKDLITATVTF